MELAAITPWNWGREKVGGGCEVKSVAHPIAQTAYGGAQRARRNTNTKPDSMVRRDAVGCY
ncbi:hypothetical protein DBV15_00668 [Temnothorax longispinosus]|uniref:Uncharacterized protein n=1 Tax=Temnothorax longispinosus TaxID=300112 RepID=A0A4S2KMN5_9HYME|nr:hypothetical protein DBV15_00668 [Temnothorax longispinosus]